MDATTYPDVSGELVLVVPAGVLIAIAAALIWYFRSKRSNRNVTPDDHHKDD